MVEISLNKSLQPEIRIVGNEKTPVIVIDQPILETDELVGYASRHASFAFDRRFAYPGIRASLPGAYVDSVVPRLVDLIREIYETPASYEFQLVHALYSLITHKPSELRPLQRVPHFDSHSPFYFATVHYLNPGQHAGTGIFRHRPTGYERVTADRSASYLRAADLHVDVNGLPAEKYINASDDHFELIAELEYRPNRLVVYPGNLLHSGLIQPERDIDDSPASGRLTANLFMYFAERSQA